jgi:RecG-like helicase
MNNGNEKTMTEERIRKVFVKDLKSHEQIHSVFKAAKKERLQTRAGKPYLALSLCDKSGVVDGRVFDNVDAADAAFQAQDYLLLVAKVGHFHGKPQLVIEQLERLDPTPIDASEFEFVAPAVIEKPIKPARDAKEKNVGAPDARLRPRLAKILEQPEMAVAIEAILKHLERMIDDRIAAKLGQGPAESQHKQERPPRRERGVKVEHKAAVTSPADQASAQRDPSLPEGLAFKPLTQLVDETLKVESSPLP